MTTITTIEQVKALLEKPKSLTNKAATILTLALLSEVYDKLDEIYPFVKIQMEEKKTQKESLVGYQRLAVGTLITNGVLWFLHVVGVIP